MLQEIDYEDRCYVKTQLMNIHDYPIHNHSSFQVIYVLEGELSLKLFYYKYRLQPGSIHIIHTEDVHSIESITEDNLVLVISLDSNYFQTIFPHFITTVFVTNVEEKSFKKADVLRDRIFSIVAEELDPSPGKAGRVNNAAVAFINTLIQHFRGFVIEPSAKAFVHQTSHDYMQVDRISRIIQYVYENYPYKILLSDLADKEQISPYYLSHVFQKLVGLNFRDFVSHVRIEMSESAVLSTDKNISQIARDVGFSDTKYYIRHFYEHMGCHPKEYRRMYRNKVYGIAQPDIEEYPLTRLEPIIGKYTQYPVFKQEGSTVSMIELDFTADPVGALKKPGLKTDSLSGIISDFMNGTEPDNSLIIHYKDVMPHDSVISLLRELAQDPFAFKLPQIELFDSDKNLRGILTVNGLKKPMYYIVQMLQNLPEKVLSYGPNNIALQGDGNTTLLLFNPNKNETISHDIVTRNVPEGCKLTKHWLRADNSCLVFWSQLNFRPSLTKDDISNINLMSHPDISFDVIPHDAQYYTSIELAPYDVMILSFTY